MNFGQMWMYILNEIVYKSLLILNLQQILWCAVKKLIFYTNNCFQPLKRKVIFKMHFKLVYLHFYPGDSSPISHIFYFYQIKWKLTMNSWSIPDVWKLKLFLLLLLLSPPMIMQMEHFWDTNKRLKLLPIPLLYS